MAIKLAMGKGNIEVVCNGDSAIGEDADYTGYLASFKPTQARGDESLLRLTGEPTRFVLRKNLPYEAAISVRDRAHIQTGEGLKIKMGSVIEEIRYALVDIINPSDVAPEDALIFVKAADGYADPELITALANTPVLYNLWAARAKVGGGLDEIKKK